MKDNGLNSDVIHTGQILEIGNNSDQMESRNNPSELNFDYTVQKGDTLSKIARLHNIPLDELLKYNNFENPNLIRTNQKVKIRASTQRESPLYQKKVRTVDEIKELEKQYNEASDIDIINGWYKRNPSNEYYIIDDKKNNKLGLYRNGVLVREFPAIHGKNKELDDMTKTFTDENDNIIDGAGNMSTPAGLYYSSYSGLYHGSPAYMRQTKYMIDKGMKSGIPSSIHRRTIKENAVTNGCTGMDCNDLEKIHDYLQNQKHTATYILPVEEGNRFFIRNNQIQFRTNDHTQTPSHNTLASNPIYSIDYDDTGNAFTIGNKDVLQKYSQSLINNKKLIQEALKINDDTYDRLAKAALGILGVETSYGNENSGIGNFLRTAKKAVFQPFGINSSGPDYKSKYYTYGLSEDNRSVGLTQIRYKYLSPETKALFDQFGITKNDLVDDPAKAAIATMLKLGDEYLRQGSIDRAIKSWNEKPSYLDEVTKHGSNFTFLKEYKLGGVLGLFKIMGL